MIARFHEFRKQLQTLGIVAAEGQLQQTEAEWQTASRQPQSLLIKIISIVGGALSALFGLLFFLALDILDSSLVLISLGSLVLGAALWAVQAKRSLFLNTSAVTGELIGYGLVATGIEQLFSPDVAIFIILFVISGLIFFLSTHSFSQLIAALINLGSFTALLLEQEVFSALHFLLAASATSLVLLSLNEAYLLTRKPYLCHRLEILFTALLLALPIYCLLITQSLISVPYPWLAGVWLLLAGCYFFWQLIPRHHAKYFLLFLMALLPILASAGTLAGLLLLAIGFYSRSLLAILIGSLMALYSFSNFYYDLQFTLLIKAGLLFLSGCWFLLLYILLNRIRHA